MFSESKYLKKASGLANEPPVTGFCRMLKKEKASANMYSVILEIQDLITHMPDIDYWNIGSVLVYGIREKSYIAVSGIELMSSDIDKIEILAVFSQRHIDDVFRQTRYVTHIPCNVTKNEELKFDITLYKF